jgi:prophage regulatory protein
MTQACPAAHAKCSASGRCLRLSPFSRTTLYQEMGAGRFPKAREIAPRRGAWHEDDVKAWQEALDRR